MATHAHQPPRTPHRPVPAKPKPDPVLLTVREAAERLGVGKDKVYAMIRADQIYAFGPGRLLIPVGEIKRLQESDWRQAAPMEQVSTEGISLHD